MTLQSIQRLRINRVLVAFIFAAIFMFFSPLVTQVLAQTDATTIVAETAGLQSTPLPVIIGRIIGVILGLLGIILLGYIIYAGFLWMTAGGKPEQVEKAKKTMVNAVVGMVIILSSFALTNFVVRAITGGQGIFGSAGSQSGFGGGSSVELQSGSFGRGAIRDHFPTRGATDVSRNTKIYVTFKEEMDIASFAKDYNVSGTPLDVSDDVVTTLLNTDNVKIYITADGTTSALASDAVVVGFTDNLKTFVFNPPILGSNSKNVQYTVALSENIKNASGRTVLSSGGYLWNFTVGTEIDLTPPTVQSVTPQNGGVYDRNISVQINFSEGVDPISATGTYDPSNIYSNFKNIQVKDENGAIVPGTYATSNEYKTITFTALETCGVNSCGEDMYCLPGSQAIAVDVLAATPGTEPPQVDIFPYDGVTDISGNSLDGNGDGTVGDKYAFAFSTTGDINLSAPAIESVSPAILAGNVDPDQPIIITFNTIMSSASLGAETISVLPNPDHELWYSFRKDELTESGAVVTSTSDVPIKTQLTVKHGIFLQSTDLQTYRYSVNVTDAVRSEYQNCYNPAEGPGVGGETCGTSAAAPYCCNGVASNSACSFF